MALSVHSCPGCSRVIQFSHADTNIWQCVCGAVLELRENVVLKKISLPVIDFSNDLIETGSGGVFNNAAFKILGRFKAWFADGAVNYWTILFDDNTLGYICESYGQYSVLIKSAGYKKISSSEIDALKTGKTEELNKGERFLLKSKQKIQRIEVEGEVCLPLNKNEILVCEFASETGKQFTVVQFLKDYIITYSKTNTSFSGLQLTGISQAENKKKEFTCEQCHRVNEVLTWPYLQSFACVGCREFYRVQRGSFKDSDRKGRSERSPDLEIGSKGFINNREYTVIGYALKEDTTTWHSQWKEYTLYNAQEGFAFLSEYEGHWIFVQEKGDSPVIISNSNEQFEYNNEPFKLYNKYCYKVIDAVGEFPYDILSTLGTVVREFIAPPEMWIEERSGDDITWFHAQHVDRKYMQEHFTFPNGISWPSGVGAIEPKGYINPFYLLRTGIIAVIVLLIVHSVFNKTRQNKHILDTQLYFDSTGTVTYVSEKFQLAKTKSNLQFDIAAPVNNSWISVTATLVNTENGTEYAMQKDIEYYHGYDDGNWSEGSTSGTGYISSIPKGNYILQVDGLRDAAYVPVNNFSISATYDTPNDRNVVVIIIFVLLWPVGKFLLVNYNEKRRWYNSPFSPYHDDEA